MKSGLPPCRQDRYCLFLPLCSFHLIQSGHDNHLDMLPRLFVATSLIYPHSHATFWRVGVPLFCCLKSSRTAFSSNPAVSCGLTTETDYIMSADGYALSYNRTRSCCPLLFFGMAFRRSLHHFSVAKIVCSRERLPEVLTNGVTASIFLYRALRFCLRLKIKSIDALSLVHPFSAPTF